MGKHLVSHRESACITYGYTRDTMKKQILPYLVIGNKYMIKSSHKGVESCGKECDCVLVELGTQCAVFEYADKTRESFLYIELWIQKMKGSFKMKRM